MVYYVTNKVGLGFTINKKQYMNTITLNELPQLEDNFNTEESLQLNIMDL